MKESATVVATTTFVVEFGLVSEDIDSRLPFAKQTVFYPSPRVRAARKCGRRIMPSPLPVSASPGTDETGTIFRRSLPQIRCQPRLSPALGARELVFDSVGMGVPAKLHE